MKRNLRISLAVILFLILPAAALADGKFYPPPETVPPGPPYQRAVIAHDGEKELLILQSKFEGEAKEFGWVVPVPSVPELASMDPERTEMLFWSLDKASGPDDTQVSAYLAIMAFFCSLGMLLYAVFMFVLIKARTVTSTSLPPGRTAILGALLFIMAVLLAPLGLARNVATGLMDIVILKEQQVGIYDIKVIKAQDSGGLTEWLSGHGYSFGEADKKAFDSYIEKGWCFVAAQVDLKKAEEEGFSSNEGLVNPLVMLFESKEIVYPLALTGTIGNETMVLLYVFDSHKVIDPTGRFSLRYVGQDEIRHFELHMVFEPEDFRQNWNFAQGYLTKLKATLKSEQMKEDLILRRAPDDEPYREHIYRW